MKAYRFSSINQYVSQQMSQLSHAQFPLRRHPHLLVDHRRAGSASVADSRGADAERLTGSGGRLHFGMVAGIKSERWPASNRNRWPDCVGIRSDHRLQPNCPKRGREGARAKTRPQRQSSVRLPTQKKEALEYGAGQHYVHGVPRCGLSSTADVHTERRGVASDAAPTTAWPGLFLFCG
jgi:hypothetical protein